MQDFETVVVETDLLILGGGMAACGAAVEAAYWAKKNNLKVTMVDKAAVDRSGAVAMGLSAINQYVGLKDGQNTVKNYVDYVRNDLMGVTREDLVADIARHVDSSVHLFEKWGLPIWKDEGGGYVHEGRWQLMINGESYKVVVAEAAKNAIGAENIYERIFITGPIMDGETCKGAYGFSVRENKFYVFKSRSTLVSMGGGLGLQIDLAQVPADHVERDGLLLFSESAGRFIVTVNPARREAFEDNFKGTDCAKVGMVTDQPQLTVRGLEQKTILAVPVEDLKAAWKMTFGDLI